MLKRSICLYFTKQRAFFSCWSEEDSIWREQESGGIWRNLEESGVNTGIPVPQEFLQKIAVTAAKSRNSCNPLQNHTPVKNSSGKHRKKKKSSGILFFSVFEPPK
jgi:hypothetical protein